MPTELTDNRPEEQTPPVVERSGSFWRLLHVFLRRKEAETPIVPAADTAAPSAEPIKEEQLTVDKQTALSLVLNRYSKLRKAGVIGRKKGEIGIFHEHTDEGAAVPAVESDEPSADIALAVPEQSIIPEWEYENSVRIPASLLEEARELEQLTPQISAKDVEEAAKFLGVFSGHVDLSSFADYAVTDATDLSPEERAQIQAEGGSVGGSGGLFKELRDLIRRQKSLLQNLSGISAVFNPAILAKLMRGSQAVADSTAPTQPTLALPVDANALGQTAPVPTTAQSVAPTPTNDVLAVPETTAKPVALHTSDPTRLDERFLSQTPVAPAAPQVQPEISTDAPVKTKSSWWSKKEAPATEPAAAGPARGAEIQAGESAAAGPAGMVETVVVPANKANDGVTLDAQDVTTATAQDDFLENAAAPAATVAAPITEGVAAVTAENAFDTKPEEKVTLEVVQQDREPTYWEKLSMQREAKAKAKEEERQLKAQAKKEKEEEKQWAAEAKRREKLMEEKKKQLAGQKPEAAAGVRTQIIIPKTVKKQGGFKAFMDSLNYMGMEKDRIGFIDNMGTMMDAGLPLIEALNALKNETRNKQMKKLLGIIIAAVETGSPLWRAMDATYFFRQQQVAMVRVGEEAGNLVENLRYLSIQEEKDRSLRSKVKTAMIYPVIVLTMLTGIVLGLGMFVLPQLVGVLFSLGVPLPFVTRCIVMFTNFFEKHGSVFVPSMFACVVVMIILNKYTSFKVVVQWVVLHIPGIGVLVREATLSRFGVVMGGLMQAGVPVTEALESIAKVTALVGYKKFYYQLLEHVKLGDSFGTAFKKIRRANKCFPPGFQQLIVTGEKSGSLTKIMFKIAEIHEKHASEVAEKLPVILEPMLLLFIGGLVGTIALGILAPIYSVVGKVGS